MFCACPCGEVVAEFRDELQREVEDEAVDLRDVLFEQREERRADTDRPVIRLGMATDGICDRARC